MDTAEFNIRVVALKDRLFRLARLMLGDSAEAEDAVQDVYEKLWRRRDDLERYDNIEAAIYTSTRNHCHDRLRSRKVRGGAKVDGVVMQTVSDVAQGDRADMVDLRAIVEREIAALPPKQQAVIHLRDVEGCEIDEIARITAMEESAVRVNLSRARKTVKERMIKIMNYGV